MQTKFRANIYGVCAGHINIGCFARTTRDLATITLSAWLTLASIQVCDCYCPKRHVQVAQPHLMEGHYNLQPK